MNPIAFVPILLIEIEPYGIMPMVKARINGVECSLMLDTGSSQTVLSKRFAEQVKLNLEDKEANYTIGAGNVELPMQISKEVIFSFNKFPIKYPEISVLDLSNVDKTLAHNKIFDLGGLLGSDVFRIARAEINFNTKTLMLYDPNAKID